MLSHLGRGRSNTPLSSYDRLAVTGDENATCASPPRTKEQAVRRRHFKQIVPLEERLRLQAKADREQAERLPPCREREELLLRARRAETSSHLAEWLNSPGLQPPR